MADHLHDPQGAQTRTATTQKLNKGPEDMPDRGKSNPEAQITATQAKLSRNAQPVAAFGAHPNMGQTQTDNATQATLKRNATSPYEHINKTKPQESL